MKKTLAAALLCAAAVPALAQDTTTASGLVYRSLKDGTGPNPAATDVVRVLDGFAKRSRHSMLFTFAPRSPALMMFWLAGKAFPRSDRSPAIEPIAEDALRRVIGRDPGLASWSCGRTLRVASGFYTSQAMELVHR